MPATLNWSAEEGAHPLAVSTRAALEQALDLLDREARATRPFVVELDLDGEGILSIGLGLDRTVLCFSPSDGGPPYYRSYTGESASVLVFFYYGSWSEFPERGVPLPFARQAVRYFWETGRLAPFLCWRKV